MESIYTQAEFGFEDSTTNADEIFASQQLFEILKSLENNYFNELDTYETLDIDDKYDEMRNEENSTDEEESSIEDYDEDQSMDIRKQFYVRRDGKHSGMG